MKSCFGAVLRSDIINTQNPLLITLPHQHKIKEDTPPITVHQITMARGKGQQTSGGTKKEKKETRQERRARLEAEAAAREVSE